MGDRANVLVKDGEKDSGVYLYTHWFGTELPQTLQSALKRNIRWDDGPYLTRIIFDEMTKGNRDEEIGFGISANCGDGDHRVLIVDAGNQTVKRNNTTCTFKEYIYLTEEELHEKFW